MDVCSLGSISELAYEIRHARQVELEVYVLQNPLLLYSLETAARHGASVTVHLGDPRDARPHATNETAIRELSSAGVQVTAAAYGPEATHAKIAAVDGALYLDDRNFTSDESETIIVAPHHSAVRDYVLTKRDALAAEARFIANAAGHDVLVSTESLGPSPVVDALIERARRGDDVRVMYDPQTRDRDSDEALAKLRAAGVHVRASDKNHKMAIVGETAWIGSANASPGAGDQREWGTTVQKALAERLRDTYDYCWSTSKAPLDAAHSSVHGDPRA